MIMIPGSGLVRDKYYDLKPSTGQNEIIGTGEDVTVSCNLLYGDDYAIALTVTLSYDPARTFTEPEDVPELGTGPGPIELHGYRGYAEPPEPLTLKLDEATYVDIQIYNDDARYEAGEGNLWGAVVPVARELAAMWANGAVPQLGGGPSESAVADWENPRTICEALDQSILGTILGVDETQTIAVESTSGTDGGSTGLIANIVYCTYEAEPYRNDPLYPHRVEVHLYRYDTPEAGAQAFSVLDGHGSNCPTDGVAVMYDCEGGKVTVTTLEGRLMPDIQTFDGAPANVDAAALQAQVLQLSASSLIALAEFS